MQSERQDWPLDTEAARRVPSTANQSSKGIFQRPVAVGDTILFQ